MKNRRKRRTNSFRAVKHARTRYHLRIERLEERALLATFVVNSTADPGNGVCDLVECTLREAITSANGSSSRDFVNFDIVGSGPHTIQPTSPLPTITDPVVIDGYTQPGASPNTNSVALGSNAILRIELDGSLAGFSHGLRISSGESTIRGLVINRFSRRDGIALESAGGNIIQGNFIGTDVTGRTDLGNGLHGISIGNVANNVIGGTTPEARNVISGNNSYGVFLFDGANNNQLQGNLIGTDVAGTARLGNSSFGVFVDDSSNNTVGGTVVEARNVISANGGFGIWVTGAENVVQGNFIGTDVSGTAAQLGNRVSGVNVGGVDNLIGGTAPGAGNVISANRGAGIKVGTLRALVQGNLIGTDLTGAIRLGNRDEGIGVQGGGLNVRIGGSVAGAGNVISDNGAGGIIIRQTTGVVVQGNHIGTDITGTLELGNSLDGIRVLDSSNVQIGGTNVGAGNLISGNSGRGLYFIASDSSRIEGNLIGTDITGNILRGNGHDGITLAADGIVVGGTTPGAGNLISGNRGNGIALVSGANDNVLQGNYIGTDVTSTLPLGNSSAGVQVDDSSDNIILANRIAFNGSHGVAVTGASKNDSIRSNSIRSNSGLGIELQRDGVTLNDPGDGDVGSNNLQNFPLLTAASSSVGSTTIQGTLNSSPNTDYAVEFFSSVVADPSGFGEGETFLGSTVVSTDASGNAGFAAVFGTPVPVGHSVTATATDPSGNTSEFSGIELVVVGNQPPIAEDDVAGEVTVSEDGGPGPVDITAAILANDSDPDLDPLTVVAIDISSITAGILNLSSGVVTFDPNGQFESLAVGQTAFQTFTYTIDDGNGEQDTGTVGIVITGVNDDPNIGAASDPINVSEADAATNTGTFEDVDGTDNVTISASAGTITFQDIGNSGSWSWEFNSTDGPTESQTVTISADDGNGGMAVTQFQLSVDNVAPTITSITVPLAPVNINDQPVSASATFNDPAGTNDESYTCTVDYGDGSGALAGTVSGTSCTGPVHSYTDSGVYQVTVAVTDKDSDTGMANAETFIVIYDPADGFVTGGGWIDSPAGACPVFCDDATGKANFGFVSKYKNGASTPTGNTEFNFKAGDLNFHSTSYDWLVIAGKKAMYKGDGIVNGDDGFTFQLNAIDGDLPGGNGIDKFRIKIKQTGGGVIYDNQMGAGDNEDPTTAIGGGQVTIHKRNNLLVEGEGHLAGSGATLSQAMLDAAVTQAIGYWSQQGVPRDRLSGLHRVDTQIDDLDGPILGSASETSNTVRIDRDAAGYGWVASYDARGIGGVRLVSVVAHEFGHFLGFDHDHALAVMRARLTPNLAIDTRTVDNFFSLWGTSSFQTLGVPVFSLSRNHPPATSSHEHSPDPFLVDADPVWLPDRISTKQADTDRFTWFSKRPERPNEDSDFDVVDQHLLDEEALDDLAAGRVADEN